MHAQRASRSTREREAHLEPGCVAAHCRGAAMLDRSVIINHAAGARLNKQQPYRVVVRIAAGFDSPPPSCFFTAAIRLLRADATERVLMLVDGKMSSLAHSVVAGLREKSYLAVESGLPWWNSSQALVLLLDDESEKQRAMQGSLRLASRVVWSDPSSALATRRRPYEVAWTWCQGRSDADDEQGCQLLPAPVSDFHVQARTRRASRRETQQHECARQISVRSTWTGSRWYDLASLQLSRQSERTIQSNFSRGEWMLENVCLGYSGPNPTRGSTRWNILAQAHGSSRQLLWPLPWPDMYAEYVPGWLRLDSETADHWLTNMVNMSEMAPHAPLRRCDWHADDVTAFLTEVTMDNLYHALIHAVPMRELFSRILPAIGSGRGVHLLPHYTQYWPSNFSRSVGWQILARSLGVSAADFPYVAARAQALTTPGKCNCYRRMYGGHSKWMPPPYMKPGRRVADFRSALAASVGRLPAQRRILFQLRHNGVRQIVNEAEVVSSVQADQVVGGLVKFAVMESLSVMEQYELVSTSRALAGMHGMGLAWAMLLASDAGGKASCLEITGQWAKFNRLDYYSLSKANGVQYIRLSMPNAPECIHCRRCSYRTCGNVTATVSTLIAKLRYMASIWA